MTRAGIDCMMLHNSEQAAWAVRGESARGHWETDIIRRGSISVPHIEIDRGLFRRLVERWYKLEIEHRGFRTMLEEAKQQNPDTAANLEAFYQMKTDSLRNDPHWIEFDSESSGALATEDDEAFLELLDQFLSRREAG